MFETIALGMIAALDRMDAMVVIGVFALLLLALFASALLLIARGRAPAFYQSAPTLLTTLGILGTFLGIAIGLLQFDVTQVEYSIPMLLDGLKLAFLTSIVGILLGACLRLVLVIGRDAAPAPEQQETPVDTATIPAQVDLTPLLLRQTELAQAQLATTRELTQRLGQLDQGLNATLERHHEALRRTIEGFAAQLSELGSRQLIAALEQVIRDFNSSLGEQFGENFRRLDGAVAKLLQWQQQYREHLQALEGQLDHAIEGTERSEATLQALTRQALQISRHVEDQEATMAGLRRETMELEALLGGIAELRDKAREAFPAMDARLATMLESIENAVLAAQLSQGRLAGLAPDTPAFARPGQASSHGALS